MTREERLLSGVSKDCRIIEIGPGYNPVAPKAKGWNTHVVDHASREELRQKYTGAPVNLDAFEEVDTIWRRGLLHEAVPSNILGSCSLLIASHMIEHVPDLAGFLRSAAEILKPEGAVSLAIPDRRYCFDYFKPPSSTGDILEAFMEGRARHSLRSAWNHAAYAMRMDGLEAWGQHAVFNPGFIAPFEDLEEVFRGFQAGPGGEYVDCHAWQFTPAGFSLIVLELGLLGVIDWHVDRMYGPEGCEFLVTLRRGTERFDRTQQVEQRRMTLLLDQLAEWREQLDYAIAGGITAAAGLSTGAMAARFAQRLSHQDSRMTELEDQIAHAATEIQELSGRLAEVQTVLGRLVSRIAPLRKLASPFRRSRAT